MAPSGTFHTIRAEDVRPIPPSSVAAAAAALTLLLLAGEAYCLQDPSLKWRTIQTVHFNVNYYEGLEAVAQRVAAAAEEAHERLVPAMAHAPKRPTEITITDELDAANGWALTVPFNQIKVWATAPNDMSTLQDYDDWYFGLIVHEYAHILHMDNYGGIASVVNAVFGKVYPPNNAQPLWIIEGYAVLEESTKTGGGRLRSSQWDMMMRTAVLEDQFEPIDVVTIGPLSWPHGTSHYLYGSYFIKYMAETYGEDVLARMSEQYGKSLLPYGVNRTIRDLTGKTWPEHYDDWFADARTRYGAQAEQVTGRGIRAGMQLTDTGEVDLGPRFSPDGSRIAYFSWDGHDRSGLLVLDVEEPLARLAEPPSGVPDGWRPESILRTTGQGAVDWTPDGEGLVYARTEVMDNWYAYHDLYHVDIATGAILRLTTGGRSRQPDVSSDGELIAYTVNGAGTSSLAVAPAGADPEPIFRRNEGGFSQVYSPRFSPDDGSVAYSLWTEGGLRDVYVLDLEAGESRAVTSGRSLDTGPVWDPGGRYLYYSSDRTGIANIYALDLQDGSLWQVTNVLSGAYQPDVSPDGRSLVYVGYHARGYDLYLMELEPATWMPVEDEPLDRPEADLSWTGDVPELEPERYNPLRTLYPRYWSFAIAEDAWGYALTLLTTGMDVAGHHSIGASVDTGLEGRLRLGYSIDYALLMLPVHLALGHSRTTTRRWGLRIDDEWKTWTEIRYSGRIDLALPISRSDWFVRLALSYRLAWMHSADPLDVPMDPNAALPHLPDRGWLSGPTVSAFFSSARGSHYGVSMEEGWSTWASVHADLPEMGSDYRAVSFNWGATVYLEMPWLRHHVLALRLAGGFAWSDFERRGYFSVGGYPDEDILLDLVNQVRASGIALRGYPPGVRWGDQYYLLNAEYRLPLWNIFRGLGTLPWQINRLYASVFSDTGAAFRRNAADWDGVLTSVGGEVYVTMTFGYYEGVIFKAGYARGLMKDGINDFYVILAAPF